MKSLNASTRILIYTDIFYRYFVQGEANNISGSVFYSCPRQVPPMSVPSTQAGNHYYPTLAQSTYSPPQCYPLNLKQDNNMIGSKSCNLDDRSEVIMIEEAGIKQEPCDKSHDHTGQYE